ncbi:MAG: hypothetical protein NWE89_06435 [Candidatus Bathyarchaeota archaeon]|nr:hypothetical protein [Candidatus Bathyarchaeota archaeon]
MTDYENTINEQVASARYAADPKLFATDLCWIQNQNNQKIEKWQPWPFLLDLIDIIQQYDLIYILKASQLGISWLVAILNLWTATFGETAKCLMLSQGQTEAQDLLSKVAFIHDNLPEYLKLPTDKNNREAFTLKDGRAEIRALPSTDKAGHGFQGTLVTRDELARHEEARANFRAVSRSGAKLIELSTANKDDPTNYFGEKTEEFYNQPQTTLYKYPSGVELYTNPTKPGQCLVFLAWDLRPTRLEGLTLDEWWDSRIIPRYTAAEIEEQFPKYITDVFKASLVRAYFEFQALEDMGYDVCPPMRQKDINTYNNVVRVYKPPITGRRYICFTDPSDGIGDPFVTGVMDYVTGEVVASATGMEKVDRVGEIHDYLVREYNKATNTYEYTGSVGGTMWKVLENLNTPNQAPRRKVDGKIDEGKKGQWVSGEHKLKIFGDLAFAIAKRQIVCHDREFMQQSKMVTRDKTIDGREKIGTDRKQSFDWVMMMAGLWQLHKFMPVTEGQMKCYSYK